jgi:hypothetical protein
MTTPAGTVRLYSGDGPKNLEAIQWTGDNFRDLAAFVGIDRLVRSETGELTDLLIENSAARQVPEPIEVGDYVVYDGDEVAVWPEWHFDNAFVLVEEDVLGNRIGVALNKDTSGELRAALIALLDATGN